MQLIWQKAVSTFYVFKAKRRIYIVISRQNAVCVQIRHSALTMAPIVQTRQTSTLNKSLTGGFLSKINF